MKSFYWQGGLMEAQGVVHVVYKNRGVRLLTFCSNDWWNIRHVGMGTYRLATCLACLDHPVVWHRLRRD